MVLFWGHVVEWLNGGMVVPALDDQFEKDFDGVIIGGGRCHQRIRPKVSGWHDVVLWGGDGRLDWIVLTTRLGGLMLVMNRLQLLNGLLTVMLQRFIACLTKARLMMRGLLLLWFLLAPPLSPFG